MTLPEFLSRFDRSRKAGAGYLVRCPAHEDQTASLSVGEGTDGRLLLKCHAGCQMSAILAALNLEEKDLFPPKLPAGDINKIYDYADEAGTVLFQVVRMTPKDFRQRRPDGRGGWIWNLAGVRRVPYRLPELRGRKAIAIAEGEKDVDALWAIGVPATTNPGGAGKWHDAYTEQLKILGIERVAVFRDNDEPGKQHQTLVARSCHAAGLEVRGIDLPGLPAKGDVSDYLAAGHDRAALQALIKQTPIWTSIVAPARTFLKVGQGHYHLSIQPEDIVLKLEKVGRHGQSWWGQLGVQVNGSCPHAKIIDGTDNLISESDFNLTSDAAREKRAKNLANRSGNDDLDWLGFIEQLCLMTLRAEREGTPAQDLIDADTTQDNADRSVWTFEGFPLLQKLPQILFGDSGNGKSYFALWLAGCLALEDVPVLYCDWEFEQNEHAHRLAELFQPRPRGIKYLKCVHPLEEEVDRIRRQIDLHQCRYVICDSLGFAIRGPAEYAEGATAYFNALRELGVGSLSIAHIPKQRDDNKEAEIYGTNFFKHGARSIWFVQRAEATEGSNQIQFGLFHRKYNLGPLHPPLAYTLTFEPHRTRLTPTSVEANEDLAVALPLKDRLVRILTASGPMTVNDLAKELNVQAPSIRVKLIRHPSLFIRVGKKISIKEKPALEF